MGVAQQGPVGDMGQEMSCLPGQKSQGQVWARLGSHQGGPLERHSPAAYRIGLRCSPGSLTEQSPSFPFHPILPVELVSHNPTSPGLYLSQDEGFAAPCPFCLGFCHILHLDIPPYPLGCLCQI